MRLFPNIAGILTTAALLCTVACGSLRAAVIQFKPRASVSTGVITLGDVAQVLDGDAAAVAQLEQIVLGPAPAAGSETRLEFANIRSRLNATGVNLAETEFSGAAVIVVSRGGENAFVNGSLSPAALESQRARAEKLVAEAIQKSFAERDPNAGSLIVQVKLNDRDVTLIVQNLVYRSFEVVGGDPHTQNEQMVGIRYRDRNGSPAEIGVQCRVTPQPMILAARYTIPPNHILREADLVWRQAENVEGVVTRLEDALNRETKRSIRQDEPIRATEIRAVPLIRSNDIVTVISRLGGVTIRGEMKSRNEGTLGETVTLVSLKGRDTVLARVTGLHEAEVISLETPRTGTLQDATGRIEFRGDRR